MLLELIDVVCWPAQALQTPALHKYTRRETKTGSGDSCLNFYSGCLLCVRPLEVETQSAAKVTRDEKLDRVSKSNDGVVFGPFTREDGLTEGTDADPGLAQHACWDQNHPVEEFSSRPSV